MNAWGRKQKEKGFTLIELLVVIAIIGLLASIILASLNTARVKGRDAKRIADLHDIQGALELYYEACGTFPTSSSALTANQAPTASALQITDNNGCPAGTTFATFMSGLPADPNSGYPYLYTAFGPSAANTVCTGYHLGAELELGATVSVHYGANAEGYGNTKCKNGGYTGNSGGYDSTHEVAAQSGDFNGGGSVGTYVYDVTP